MRNCIKGSQRREGGGPLLLGVVSELTNCKRVGVVIKMYPKMSFVSGCLEKIYCGFISGISI